MMVKLTVRSIVNLGLWSRLCEYKGWDKHIIREGLISLDSEVEFDDEFLKNDVVPLDQAKIFLFSITSEKAIYCGTLLARDLEDAKLRLNTIHEVVNINSIQEIDRELLYNIKNKHMVISRIPL